MPLQDIISQRILNVYSDQIQKANVNTYEWRTVHGKTKTFQRRYKVRAGDDAPKEHPKLGTRNSTWSAGLSDRLTHGANINGIFYDNKGERIHLTKEQLEEAKQQYSQQSIALASKGPEHKREVDLAAKKKKDAILEHVSKKDPLYLAEVKKLQDVHARLQRDESGRKRRISLQLDQVKSTNKPSGIALALKTIRGDIKEDIDPTLTITSLSSQGKEITVKRHLDDLIASFEKLATNLSVDNKVTIKDISIDDMDEYSIDDFTTKNHIVDPKTHQKIYDRVNKKLSKPVKDEDYDD
jgi:hypothetical protein